MAELDDGGAHASVTRSLESDGVPVLQIAGELDISNVATIEAQCEPSVQQAPGRVVFDFSSLQFIDSSGIAMLLRAAQTSRVEIRNPPEVIRRIIAATGLADVLHIDQ